MVKAFFIASSHSAYRDQPGKWYHFPNAYFARVAQAVGDWVVFHQGRPGGGEAGYHAVQRLDRVLPDPTDATHSYATLDRATELGFERLVPRFRLDDTPFEIGLPRARGSSTASVRLISDADFVAIVTKGLREAAVSDALPRTGPLQDFPMGMSDAAEPFVPRFGAIRPQVLMSRALRDRAFARQVKRA